MNNAVVLVILIPLLLLMWEQSQQAPKPNQQAVVTEEAWRGAQAEISRLKDQVTQAGTNDQPPIITISDTEVYSFPSGKAELSPDFERLLTDAIIPKLEKLARDYRCDIIEVIGHTDEQPIGLASNLDVALLPALNNGSMTLTAGSNLDLGSMRAWSVIRFLKADVRLAGKRFYGYSAGQTILPDGNIAAPAKPPQNDPARRRIEIRLRRLK
jgi:flagellar motor protein MotB